MDNIKYIGIEKDLPVSVDIEWLRPNTAIYCLSELTLRKIIAQAEIAASNSKYELLSTFTTGLILGVVLMKIISVGLK